MTALTPFVFEGTHMVRTAMQKGDPWFVAMDVCRVLEIEKHRDAIAKLDADERGSVKVDTLGGAQELAAVNESGLYTLILRSRKAMTPGTVQHRFRKWVTSEVLPSIRKSGGYGHQSRITDPKYQRHAIMLIARLRAETSPTLRRTIYALLEQTLDAMGLEAPPLESLGREIPPPPDIVGIFWQQIAAMQAQGIAINHARDPYRLALHLPTLRDRHGLDLSWTLRTALKRDPRFIAVKAVNSMLTGQTVKCWVFTVLEGSRA